MPLWNIYHTPDTFDSESIRADLASNITELYTSSGLPAFYVVVQFIPLPAGNVFVAAKSGNTREKPFVRFVVDHMAVHRHEIPVGFTARFSDRINEAIKPHVADKGYDWEITVTDTPRDFWRFNGIAPPPFKSDAEKVWADSGRPSVWEPKAKV